MDINHLNIHLLLEMHNGSAATLLGTIFVDGIDKSKIMQYQISVVLNQYITFANSP